MDSREQSCYLFPCSRQSLLLAVPLYARLIGPYASGNPVSASYGSAGITDALACWNVCVLWIKAQAFILVG